MNKTFALFTTIGIAFAAFFGWHYYTDSLNEETEEEAEPHASHIVMDREKAEQHGVTIRHAGPGKIVGQLSTRGKVIFHPDRVAHILPRISGVANEALKNRGDPVRAGEVLAVVESREIAEIKAGYLAALERKKLADSLYEREYALHDKKVSSEEDYLNAKARVEEAKIEWQLAKQKLYAFGLGEEDLHGQEDTDLRFYEIRSPIHGIVIDRDITYGEYIEETTPIYTIAQIDPVWVEIGVYPKDFQKVKEGQTVEVTYTDAGCCSQGKIIYLSPMIDPETITAKAIVELENGKGQWKPGAFVIATIRTDTVSLPIVVPKNAVQMIDAEPIVFVRTLDGFEGKQVRLGRSDEQSVEILAGLEPGTSYAATGAFLLKADLGKDSVEHE